MDSTKTCSAISLCDLSLLEQANAPNKKKIVRDDVCRSLHIGSVLHDLRKHLPAGDKRAYAVFASGIAKADEKDAPFNISILLNRMGILPDDAGPLLVFLFQAADALERKEDAEHICNSMEIPILTTIGKNLSDIPQQSPELFSLTEDYGHIVYTGEMDIAAKRRTDAALSAYAICDISTMIYMKNTIYDGTYRGLYYPFPLERYPEVFERACEILSYGCPSFGDRVLTSEDLGNMGCAAVLNQNALLLRSFPFPKKAIQFPVSTCIGVIERFARTQGIGEELEYLKIKASACPRWIGDDVKEDAKEFLERLERFADKVRDVGGAAVIDAVRAGVPIEDIFA